MPKRIKAHREKGRKDQVRHHGKLRGKDAVVTFESPPPLDSKLQRGFGECYRWNLTMEEYDRWLHSRWTALGTLRVLNSGIFVEARGHWRERSNLAEGILIYCTEGKGWYLQNEKKWEVLPGDLLYCPPLSRHRYWADTEHPWTIFWMHLSGDLLPQYENLLGLAKRGPVRRIGLHNDIIADFNRLTITHPFTSIGDSEFFCIQANAFSILGRIAALPQNIAEIGAAYAPIQKAISLMNASLHQSFDLPGFAREAGFSKRHFTRQFRRDHWPVAG